MTNTTTELPNEVPAGPDASDVITGPIGRASLRDPASSGPMGADLDRLPAIDEDVGGRLATKGHEMASALRSERAERPTPGESITLDESSTGVDSPTSS